jgi:hypothetical protein
MKSVLAVLILSSALAAVTMLFKSNFVLQLLTAAPCFAVTMLSAFAWNAIKFVV